MSEPKNEVKIKAKDGKAHCPVSGKEGEYKQDGQNQSETKTVWVWENSKLIAVPKR